MPIPAKFILSLAPKADDGTNNGREAAAADFLINFLLLDFVRDLLGIPRY